MLDLYLPMLAAGLLLFCSYILLGSYTVRVRAFCNVCHVCHLSVCLSRIRSQQLSETGAKFCCLYRKSGSPSKSMMSELATYPKSNSKSQNSPKWGSRLLSECLSLLFCSISDAACFYSWLCRTVTTLTWETVATSTGDCCRLTRPLPRKLFWLRSPSSPRKLICWSRLCLTSWSVTSPAWRPSTTSHQMHLSKAEEYQHDEFSRQGLIIASNLFIVV